MKSIDFRATSRNATKRTIPPNHKRFHRSKQRICTTYIHLCIPFSRSTTKILRFVSCLLARVSIFTTLRFYQLFVAVIEQLLFLVFYIPKTQHCIEHTHTPKGDEKKTTRKKKWEKATKQKFRVFFFACSFRFFLVSLFSSIFFSLFIRLIFWKKINRFKRK